MPLSGQNDAATRKTPERKTADSLPSAVVLASVGGLLDAFLYMEHGKVFAGAMTGNAVLCGIALLSHNGMNALHHALPIIAFFCGMWAAEVLQGRIRHHSITVALAAEAAVLLTASFLSRNFPDPVFIFLISGVAALQIATFRKVDQYSYNATFITGDMRTFVVGLYESREPGKRAECRGQARDLGLIIAAFLGGVVLGAFLSPRFGNHTLWLAAAAVLTIFAAALRRSLSSTPGRS